MWIQLLTSIQTRMRAFFRRRQLERDLDDELSFHLAMRQQDGDSRAEASRVVGNQTALKESCREEWRFAWLEALMRDLRYAFRQARRNPLFAATAVATLALGIGANTAIFSMVESILLRPLPYHRPNDLFTIREVLHYGGQKNVMAVNAGNLVEWQRHASAFLDVAAVEPTNDNLAIGGGLVQVHGARSSAVLFPMLGIQPELGRGFLPGEDRVGSGLFILLTHSLWREVFDADPQVVGKTVPLNGYPAVVVGVLPASFYFPRQDQLSPNRIAGWTHPVQYFVNLSLKDFESHAGSRDFEFTAIGRLRPGVTSQQALAKVNAVEAQISEHGDAHLSAQFLPLKTAVVGPAARGLWLLMAGSGVVLLIVCVNLAGLAMARGTARTHEIAVRAAIGAGRADLLRQFVTEGVLLALTGALLGVAGAWWGLRALVHGAPVTLPRLESIRLDGTVLVFTGLVSTAAGVFFSLLPALRLSGQPLERLKWASPATGGSRPVSRMHQALAASEVALCTVLLVCALLFARSLSRVFTANAWLNDDHVITVQLTAPPSHYQRAPVRLGLYRRLLDQVSDSPGVTSVGLINALPLGGALWTQKAGLEGLPDAERPSADFRFASPQYFDAIGLRLVSGRRFTAADADRRVVVVSESLERRLPAGFRVLGKRMEWMAPNGKAPLEYEVCGVVRDARTGIDEQAPPTVYMPFWEWPPWNASVVVRTAGDPSAIATGLRRTIRQIDSQIAVPQIATMHQILDRSVAPRRFLTWLGVLFAASTMLLAALGLYGVLSLGALQREREFAIRRALGAEDGEIFRLVIARAARFSLAGVAAGTIGALASARLIASFLFEVEPSDPATFGYVWVLVIAVVLLASYLPARRAIRVEPTAALRVEG